MAYGSHSVTCRQAAVTFPPLRPRHQGWAHGGRAPAKIARASAKLTGLFMLKNRKRPNGGPVLEAGADG